MRLIGRLSLALVVISVAAGPVIGQGAGRTEKPKASGPKTGGPRPAARTKVTIVSDPANCQVSINGKWIGDTDAQGELVLDLPAGRHKVRVIRDGFVPQERNVAVSRNSIREQFVLPALLVSIVVVTNPPEAEVYLDGAYRGTTRADGMLPLDGVKMGDHLVRVQRRGYLPKDQPFKVASNGAPVRLELSPDPISQRVQVIDQKLSADLLFDAFGIYGELHDAKPSHPDLEPALERILDRLQYRTVATLGRMGTRGLTVTPEEARELSTLHQLAKKFKASDPSYATFVDYWDAKYYFAKAQASITSAEKDDNLQKSLVALARVSSAGVRSSVLLYDIGWLYSSWNDRVQALRNFSAAHSADMGSALPVFALGLLEISAADQIVIKKEKKAGYERALAYFNQAILLNPRLYEAHAFRGIAYAGLGKNREAIASGQQAVTINPSSGIAHFALGVIYFQKGKSEYPNADREFAGAMGATVDALDAATRRRVQEIRSVMASRK